MRSSHSGYVPAFRRRVGFVISHPGWPQGRSVIPVDVRVVAATNVDLRDEVAAGRFRSDLFFRLNVFPITLPPLKDRRDDISLLMEAFLRRYCEQHLRHVPGFTPRAVQALLQYDFPGHIRELQNLVERGVIMALHDDPIDVHHLFRGGKPTTQMRHPIHQDYAMRQRHHQKGRRSPMCVRGLRTPRRSRPLRVPVMFCAKVDGEWHTPSEVRFFLSFRIEIGASYEQEARAHFGVLSLTDHTSMKLFFHYVSIATGWLLQGLQRLQRSLESPVVHRMPVLVPVRVQDDQRERRSAEQHSRRHW